MVRGWLQGDWAELVVMFLCCSRPLYVVDVLPDVTGRYRVSMCVIYVGHGVLRFHALIQHVGWRVRAPNASMLVSSWPVANTIILSVAIYSWTIYAAVLQVAGVFKEA